MLKKRLIFTLLYNNDNFVLSRNFSSQKIGDLTWLLRNYNFDKISQNIDELIILDISKKNKCCDSFFIAVSEIAKRCFMPICIGGGVDDFNKVKRLFDIGVDKLLFNTSLSTNSEFMEAIAVRYGSQSIVAAIDIRRAKDGQYKAYVESGTKELHVSLLNWINHLLEKPVGELLLNSIDRDGTGMGLDFDILSLLPENPKKSIILSGGVGNSDHILEGLLKTKIDAVATANLLNFIGDGLTKARQKLYQKKCNLPTWLYLNEIQ